MKLDRSALPAVLVALYTGYRCLPLLDLWMLMLDYDAFPWLCFLIWLVPLGWGMIQSGRVTGILGLTLGGLVISTLGEMASFNILKQTGFVCALAALQPWSPWRLLWMGGAVCWMPILGWFMLHSWGPEWITPLRFLVCLGVTGVLVLKEKVRDRERVR